MKLHVFVTPKSFGERGVTHHPDSKTVESALRQLGHANVRSLILGKYLVIELTSGVEPEAARDHFLKVAERAGIYNPVIEDLRVEVGE